MSDIRKWMGIIESVPNTLMDQPPKNVGIMKNATVVMSPRIGGGVARYIKSIPNGALVEIKGVIKEISNDDFDLPTRDYEDPYTSANTWIHANVGFNTDGTMNDKPEFTSGDIVKVADVYGAVTGPGYGVFVSYSTDGKNCVISFDGKEILVLSANISAVLEQAAKNNFGEMDNDGNLSPMSRGSSNVQIEQEIVMDVKDEFAKWIAAVEQTLTAKKVNDTIQASDSQCECGCWDCPACFPDDSMALGSVDIPSSTASRPDIHGGKDDTPMNMNIDTSRNEIEAEEYMGLEEVSINMEEDDDELFKQTNGQRSPLTYGEDNLDEEDMALDNLYSDNEESPLISTIEYMQSMGLSNSHKPYTNKELRNMSEEELDQVHNEVTGSDSVAEATEKPTKTKSQSHYLDDMDDVLNPRAADLPSVFKSDDHEVTGSDEPGQMELPTASRNTTRSRTAQMSPTELMRDMMSRIDPNAGHAEETGNDVDMYTPDDEANIAVAPVNANNVPSVISNAMQASGMQTPEWHTINNLPGFDNSNIRGMGRQVFGMFTSTPVGKIRTIANVDGQGPNTPEEMRAVAGWLRDNAEDLGAVDVSHGMAIPGYAPDVKEFRKDGVRFHVVRDQMGQYIYAYPDQDSRIGNSSAGTPRISGRETPRLRESISLFKLLKLDEEITAMLKESVALAEASTLSAMIGKLPDGKRNHGGQALVKLLHSKHKLGNDAAYRQVPFNKNVLWGEFKSNPDNFVIVQGADGVAGIKPSDAYIKNMFKRYSEKGKEYNPAKDPNLKYQVVAFKNDGTRLESVKFESPEKEANANAKAAPQNFDEIPDPTTIRTRMGLVSGSDSSVPFNVFNLLADEIGRLKFVWVTGFWGLRGERGADQEIEPSTGSVERDKMKKRDDAKNPEINGHNALHQLFNRVRPVMVKIANQELGETLARARKMMDGHNYEAVETSMKKSNSLRQFIINLDSASEIDLTSMTSFIGPIFRKAFTGATNTRFGTTEGNATLQQLATGPTSALGPLLDAFRSELKGIK